LAAHSQLAQESPPTSNSWRRPKTPATKHATNKPQHDKEQKKTKDEMENRRIERRTSSKFRKLGLFFAKEALYH
jgi:hypothetical protein